MELLDILVEREKARYRKAGFECLLSVKQVNVCVPDFYIDFGNDSAILLDVTVHPSMELGDLSSANMLLMSEVDVKQGHVVNPHLLQHFLARRFVSGSLFTNNPQRYSIEEIPLFPVMLKFLKITPIK